MTEPAAPVRGGGAGPLSRWWLLLPAAGAGRRLGGEVPKQYRRIGERSVLEWTLSRFEGLPGLAGVILVTGADLPGEVEAACRRSGLPLVLAAGGATRAESVRNGLRQLAAARASVEGEAAAPGDDRLGDHRHGAAREAGLAGRADDWVLVHDAARPCVRPGDVRRLLEAVDRPDGGLLVAPVRDTVKRRDTDGRVADTVDRDSLRLALTPQCFPARVLLAALEDAIAAGRPVTDESSAMEQGGFAPLALDGATDNLKITHPEDLALAERILRYQGVLHD
jgi:2-C-methyl-D-erythritol 4-phosphate cytidylyltransferase